MPEVSGWYLILIQHFNENMIPLAVIPVLSNPLMRTNCSVVREFHGFPDSKVHGAYMGPTWGQQDPGGPPVSFHWYFYIFEWIDTNSTDHFHKRYFGCWATTEVLLWMKIVPCQIFIKHKPSIILWSLCVRVYGYSLSFSDIDLCKDMEDKDSNI